MSDCNCIEKVVAALTAEKGRQSLLSRRDGADLCDSLIIRLSSPPAPAAEPRAALAAEKGRALEQAAEPGVERADPAPSMEELNKAYHATVDRFAAKPAPASTPAAKFDAAPLARDLWSDIYYSRYPNNIDAIASALTAARAAGRAAGDAAGYERGKAEQRAPEGCVINQNSEVLVAEPVHAAPYPFNPRHYTTEWLWRLTKQPADPDAKEAGR